MREGRIAGLVPTRARARACDRVSVCACARACARARARADQLVGLEAGLQGRVVGPLLGVERRRVARQARLGDRLGRVTRACLGSTLPLERFVVIVDQFDFLFFSGRVYLSWRSITTQSWTCPCDVGGDCCGVEMFGN